MLRALFVWRRWNSVYKENNGHVINCFNKELKFKDKISQIAKIIKFIWIVNQ